MDDISLDLIYSELRLIRVSEDANRQKLEELEFKVRNMQDWRQERQCLLSLVNIYSDSGESLADSREK
jgi:predicted 2-oxoglutarate/Fe(II)-dependent dioxygenase YbiX